MSLAVLSLQLVEEKQKGQQAAQEWRRLVRRRRRGPAIPIEGMAA